ncbi:hypothetical protein BU16DRAFT_526493 [Lophium mytilinum]|uniref:Heterokaryon incompatibility domain-containing protein n=1 Tax=Lophium mytilinum TaxID=390894 RepID=A0A6A6QUZ1_9PEZI|nr:hypothetical protein BU16DRAFT_526493 [Lophium mytilinum]
MWSEELDLAIISKVIKAMPLLRSITLAADISEKDESWWAGLGYAGTGYGGMKTLNSPGLAAGVRQLGTLLLACRDAGTKLTSMDLHCLSWRFFEHLHQNDGLQLFRSATCFLTRFSLDIATITMQDEDDADDEAAECRLFLRGDVLGQILRDMTNLQHLQLSADSTVRCHRHDNLWITLGSTIRGHVWPHLTSLTLKQMATSEETLLTFVGDHMPTLKQLHLGSLLLSTGNWISAFEKIRELIVRHGLESLAISGCHYEREPHGHPSYIFASRFQNTAEQLCGTDCIPYGYNGTLECYLMYGGPCPYVWPYFAFATFDGDF